jgi:cytochrome c-type biogenesis protein CcmE
MNKKQKNKLIGIMSIIVILSIAAGLILYALKQNINLFYTPTQLTQSQIYPGQSIRIGGYVKKQSVHYDTSGQSVNFIVTDNKNEISINYHGVLPNLFREGQGVVVTGKLDTLHALNADQVLAKHDEKYMPWSLEKELKKGEKHAA